MKNEKPPKEIWKEALVKGYEVSNLGRVRAKFRMIFNAGKVYYQRAKTLKPHPSNGGYLFVRLSERGKTRKYYIHVLVAQAFIGDKPTDRPDYTVDHINRVRTDNFPWNLRYATRKEQNENRVLNPITGIDSHFSKLTEEEVLEIRKKYVGGHYTYKELSKIYGMSVGAIERVCKGESWKHLLQKDSE